MYNDSINVNDDVIQIIRVVFEYSTIIIVCMTSLYFDPCNVAAKFLSCNKKVCWSRNAFTIFYDAILTSLCYIDFITSKCLFVK